MFYTLSVFIFAGIWFSAWAKVDTLDPDYLAAYFHNLGLESSSAGVIYWCQVGPSEAMSLLALLPSHWLRDITWPGHTPRICWERSRDLDTSHWLAKWGQCHSGTSEITPLLLFFCPNVSSAPVSVRGEENCLSI